MTDEICPHGDLTADCIDCTIAPPNPQPVPPVVTLHNFTASFDGWCAECNLPIVAGRRICAMSDGTYQHIECAWRRD